ncbi:peptide chain release factor N(5)-glutamine methyltransferase [Salinisphaera sp. SPP-AMP-43]|uniref:peptide chain release factor N(5)-glutamine methyltransferase n=1 Tax=Salinisphaera sp. SPP-AMP-43 TaxID=3121288 RepID=UPI003C6E37BC
MGDTLDSARRCARQQLAAHSDSPDLDARRLLEHILGIGAVDFIAHPERRLSAAELEQLDALLQRRLAGEPIAYLVGEIGFWTLDLQVDARVLVPRPDTETLVEAVLERLDDQPATVADLGTGSGAIALALASERPHWQIWATDIDAGALDCAQANAVRLGLTNLCFAQGSWLAALPCQNFDAIVSNPPYIDSGDPHLQAPALTYEPQRALVAAEQGQADLASIAVAACSYLRPGGYLMLEHGFEQGPTVRTLLEPAFEAIETLPDLGRQPRVTLGRRPL